MFRVGMKVVCVKKFREFYRQAGEVFPTVQSIYTIRGFHSDGDAIYLSEIHNPLLYGNGTRECAFLVSFFRPVTSSKQEVSFTTGAPVDSERWDNRVKRKPQKAITALQS